jgi:hypothetical protein
MRCGGEKVGGGFWSRRRPLDCGSVAEDVVIRALEVVIQSS